MVAPLLFRSLASCNSSRPRGIPPSRHINVYCIWLVSFYALLAFYYLTSSSPLGQANRHNVVNSYWKNYPRLPRLSSPSHVALPPLEWPVESPMNEAKLNLEREVSDTSSEAKLPSVIKLGSCFAPLEFCSDNCKMKERWIVSRTFSLMKFMNAISMGMF